MTLFEQNFSSSLPTGLALYKAAQGAMSTIILKEAKEIDLSRLTFLSFTAKFSRLAASKLQASGSIEKVSNSPAGNEHLISIELLGKEGRVADASFFILERNRGLKSSVLHNLRSPKNRVAATCDPKKVIFLNQILKKYPDLHKSNPSIDCWPLDALFASSIEACDVTQDADFKVNFEVFGAADSKKGCQVVIDQTPKDGSNFVEIIQNGDLIAQLTTNTVLPFPN